MSVELHSLANGLRIVTDPMPGFSSAAIGLWIEAGSRHERAEQNGIAHFLEHMAFKGTGKRSTLEIAEAIEDVGGSINAYTSHEMTAFHARVLKEDVPLALDLLADIVLDPRLNAKEIEVERGVILQEIGQVQDTPDDVVFDWLQEAAYPDQALGRPILGPAGRVSGFSREDLFGFVEEHYGPGQIILAAAGAVDHDEIVRLAEGLFGHMAAGTGAAAAPAAFAGKETRRERDLEQAHFALAFEGPGYRDAASYTAQVHATALGGGMSSRLFQELRERRGLAYTVFAQAGGWSDTGLLTVYAGTSGAEIGALAAVTADEIRRSAEDMTPAEVARAQAQMKAGLLIGLENPAGRAERMARLLAIWGRVPTLEETIGRIDAVTAEAARDFAGGLVADGRMALALYGPVAGAPGLAELQDRLAA